MNAFTALGWRVECVTADILTWFHQRRDADLVMANLVLHHFDECALRDLLAGIAGAARVFIATEPRRSAAALAGSRALVLIGCNEVSRHDAVASVRAGFTDRELSALWPADDVWRLSERGAGLFTHLFIARRLIHPSLEDTA